MFTELILDKLGVFYEDPAHKRHGASPEISWGSMLDRILSSRGACSAHTLFPEIGEQTFNRMMKKCFPLVKLQGGGETWYYYLLSFIEHKDCRRCNTVKSLHCFHSGSVMCKECRSLEQQGQYVKYNEAHKRSHLKNRAKIKARQQLYKGERSLRVPAWYDSERSKIEDFYNNCPKGHHVDHIIPLKGKLVSGLHVLNNLQYLTAKENLSKGNRFEPLLAHQNFPSILAGASETS